MNEFITKAKKTILDLWVNKSDFDAEDNTVEDVNHPVNYTFESVNNFVHSTDVHFEELQCCCLDMAAEIDKLNALLASALECIDADSKKQILEKRGLCYHGKAKSGLLLHT